MLYCSSPCGWNSGIRRCQYGAETSDEERKDPLNLEMCRGPSSTAPTDLPSDPGESSSNTTIAVTAVIIATALAFAVAVGYVVAWRRKHGGSREMRERRNLDFAVAMSAASIASPLRLGEEVQTSSAL